MEVCEKLVQECRGRRLGLGLSEFMRQSGAGCSQAILDRVENGGKAIALERKSRAEAGGRRGGISAGRANAASFNREKQIDSACSMPRSTNGWMDGVGGTRKSSALLVRPAARWTASRPVTIAPAISERVPRAKPNPRGTLTTRDGRTTAM